MRFATNKREAEICNIRPSGVTFSRTCPNGTDYADLVPAPKELPCMDHLCSSCAATYSLAFILQYTWPSKMHDTSPLTGSSAKAYSSLCCHQLHENLRLQSSNLAPCCSWRSCPTLLRPLSTILANLMFFSSFSLYSRGFRASRMIR